MLSSLLLPLSWAIWYRCPKCARSTESHVPQTGKHTPSASGGPLCLIQGQSFRPDRNKVRYEVRNDRATYHVQTGRVTFLSFPVLIQSAFPAPAFLET